MAKFGKAGPLLEGTAYGVLNEILSEFRSGDGYARPSRYEILIQPPNGFAGEGRNDLKNVKLIKPTLKRYLAGHVKSAFRRIDGDEFTVATLLPVQRFSKTSAAKVWNDSRSMI